MRAEICWGCLCIGDVGECVCECVLEFDLTFDFVYPTYDFFLMAINWN